LNIAVLETSAQTGLHYSIILYVSNKKYGYTGNLLSKGGLEYINLDIKKNRIEYGFGLVYALKTLSVRLKPC